VKAFGGCGQEYSDAPHPVRLLRADLAAPTYQVGPRGIVIEDKESLRKRLGRSPGKGDAAVMCMDAGSAARRRLLGGKHPEVNIGYAKLKERYRK